MSTAYKINNIFYTLQGEGAMTGTPSVFVRFSNCNLACRKETHNFDCDTEFMSGDKMLLAQIVGEARRVGDGCEWIVLTGGEPGLQVDVEMIDALHKAGFKLAIETNGSVELPPGLDWIIVSPKVAEHAIRQTTADEVKYVRAFAQKLPHTVVKAKHYLLSPAFNGDEPDWKAINWCITLTKEHPKWRLTVQLHKLLGFA